MFSVFCTAVNAEVLLDSGSIEALFSRGGAMVIAYRCTCGERGEWTGPTNGRRPRNSSSSRAWPVSESA
ncbi:MAG: hypothetical protein ACRD12_12145 [Acidimicrobiales bacterium]